MFIPVNVSECVKKIVTYWSICKICPVYVDTLRLMYIAVMCHKHLELVIPAI